MVGMLFPHLSEKLPGRKLKKGRWKLDRAVFVVFLFQSRRGGAADPVQERPEETAEGSRESSEEGRETGQTGEATKTLPTAAVWRGFYCFAIPVLINLFICLNIGFLLFLHPENVSPIF